MPPPTEALASRLFLGPALRTQPDRRLVTLVREGYEVAFEEIVRRYGRPLGRYAASIVGGRSEDVLQDAFAKALPALKRDDAEIDLRPWLFRIVRNAALNDLRDSPPSPELPAEALTGGRDPAEELEQREQLTDLMRRLRELPEPQRAAIVMRELEGLGHDEIAAALGLTGGGARQAIYRARQALRDGAGLLLPLPLLRLLIDRGGEAIGAGTGGALAAAGASAGGAGASGALKLGVVAAVVAGSVGAGVMQSHSDRNGAEAQAAPRIRERTGGDGGAIVGSAAEQTAPPAASQPGNQHGDSASGGDSSGSGVQASGTGAAHQVGEPSEGHTTPPRRHHEPGEDDSDRRGSGEGDDGLGSGGELRPIDDSDGHGGSSGDEASGPSPLPEEGGSDDSGGGGDSGGSGESIRSGSSGTGQEYESP